MILLNYKDNLFKYFIYISIVFVTLFVITTFINLDSNKNNNEVEMSNIVFNNETTQINVEYPRYKNDKINKIITDSVYNYVKTFKESNIFYASDMCGTDFKQVIDFQIRK